jgi:hypothetical protein
MPLTMLLGALMLLRRSLWDLDPLERLRRANRQLRSVAVWRNCDTLPDLISLKVGVQSRRQDGHGALADRAALERALS